MKLGVIGFGNMGSAIVDGLLYKNIMKNQDIYAYSRNQEKLKENCLKRHINLCTNILDLIKSVDVIIISTPSIIFKNVINKIKDFAKNKIIISVCSGANLEIAQSIFKEIHFIQTIPSTPIRHGEGILICDQKHSLNKEELVIVESLFQNISLVKFVNSELLDIASTLSGCGPAFIAMLIEALGDAGCKYGLDRKTSYELVSKMLIGTGTSYLKSQKHPAELKDEVTSPGGTTILGVTKLEECGFRNSLIKAIDAISKREK